MEYYLAIKRNEILIAATTQIDQQKPWSAKETKFLKPTHFLVKWLECWILCHVNFTTMENNNKPPKGKTKMDKESYFGLVEIKKTWQLKAICVCGLHPGLEEKFSSVQSCPTLCNPMDCSMPGFPVHYQLLYLTQTHGHQVWCHSTILSSVILFSICLQSFPVSGSFQMSLFFASGGQSIGVSASISVLPVNIQDWFPLGWTGWIFLQSKGLSRDFSKNTVQKHQFFGT